MVLCQSFYSAKKRKNININDIKFEKNLQNGSSGLDLALDQVSRLESMIPIEKRVRSRPKTLFTKNLLTSNY